MRTTITLDDDLADALRTRAHERRQPFRRVVNDAIRNGLRQEQPTLEPFQMRTSRMGLKTEVNLHKAAALADALEDDELTQKLQRTR